MELLILPLIWIMAMITAISIQVGGVVCFAPRTIPSDSIWTIVIDRTNLSEPFLEMIGKREMMKDAKLDQNSTWSPSISCVHAYEFTILPN